MPMANELFCTEKVSGGRRKEKGECKMKNGGANPERRLKAEGGGRKWGAEAGKSGNSERLKG